MKQILIDEYNYPLPDERIAKYPLAQRDHSKLLVYKDGHVSEDVFYHVGDYIPAGSLLVYNNTRVIQARLVFHKDAPTTSDPHAPAQGARIEVFCLEPLRPHDYQLSLGSTTGCTWKCMIGNAKKWKSGALHLSTTLRSTGETIVLNAERGAQTGNTYEVTFTWSTPDTDSPSLRGLGGVGGAGAISFAEILDAVGELPIPPYLNRPTEESDKTTYQTVYSRIKGSVAAPTAGLHFTDEVLDGLRARGIQTTELTLHVGAGTFQPVKTADANEHTMHTEIIAVPRQAIVDIISHLGHIVAVGTTSMRTLESLYFIGEMIGENEELRMKNEEWHVGEGELHVPQFVPYTREHTLSTHDALQAIVDYLERTGQDTLHAETQIMIEPGYIFHVVNQLITNFHQPKSTLLLLVSAFVGGDWHTIYDYALSHDFRFLSYGDSSILFRRD